jgi:hypothetical protein
MDVTPPDDIGFAVSIFRSLSLSLQQSKDEGNKWNWLHALSSVIRRCRIEWTLRYGMSCTMATRKLEMQ